MTQIDVKPTRYRAFISYCHRNDKEARWLHGALETYRVPKELVGRETERGVVPRRLGAIFRDEEELAGAAELGPKLRGALHDSAALIVVCSTEAAKSKWVGEEIRYFRHTFPDRPVLAVIANGCPGGEDECFPESLRYGVGAAGEIDRTVQHEPLAPDLTKLDRDGVKLKLIAGLLDVNYSELARRDLKRQHRRMAIAGTLGTGVTAALVVLSVIALGYARYAVKQEKLAKEQQHIAERNADLAERKAWLANVAAEEVRREADLLKTGRPAATCPPKALPIT